MGRVRAAPAAGALGADAELGAPVIEQGSPVGLSGGWALRGECAKTCIWPRFSTLHSSHVAILFVCPRCSCSQHSVHVLPSLLVHVFPSLLVHVISPLGASVFPFRRLSAHTARLQVGLDLAPYTDGSMVIQAIRASSPAALSNQVQIGDTLHSVDAIPVYGRSVDEVKTAPPPNPFFPQDCPESLFFHRPPSAVGVPRPLELMSVCRQVTKQLLGSKGTPVLLALQRPAWDGMSARWNTVMLQRAPLVNDTHAPLSSYHAPHSDMYGSQQGNRYRQTAVPGYHSQGSVTGIHTSRSASGSIVASLPGSFGAACGIGLDLAMDEAGFVIISGVDDR